MKYKLFKNKKFLFSVFILIIILIIYQIIKINNRNNYIKEYKDENFILIEGGTFEMGIKDENYDLNNDEEPHKVKVDNFYISKYEVTVEEFEKFLNYNWWYKTLDDYDEYNSYEKNKPVTMVRWIDAKAYCEWLNKNNQNYKFRLPTEAEWEYSCRAGTTTNFNTGDNLSQDLANYGNRPDSGYSNNPASNYPEIGYKYFIKPVGSYPPNDWGLYDMHGNVREYCEDFYTPDYYLECKEKGIVENPINKTDIRSYGHVDRGGSWYGSDISCTSSQRSFDGAGYILDTVGFRVVLEY